jgi:membrane protease YdiL (CAAX protease family)
LEYSARSTIAFVRRIFDPAVVRYFFIFLLWSLCASLLLLSIPLGIPLPGLALTLAFYGWLLWWLVLRGRAPERRWATLRLRELNPGAVRWTLACVPVLLMLSWALGEVYIRIVPVPSTSFNPFALLMGTPHGRLLVTVQAVGIAPVLEEFFFRGFIQHALERRWGAQNGIIAAAALFGVSHMLPWVFPLHFFLGLAFGYAVYATRSIWSGVILHAANNAVAVAGLGLQGEEPSPTPTLWDAGPDAALWVSLAMLVGAGILAVWAAQKLRNAGWERSLRRQQAGR